MRIIALHDEMGNILGLALPVEDVEVITSELVTEAGQYLTEVEVQIGSDGKPQETLAKIAQSYRVERLPTSGRLVKRHISGRATG
jgi:hypothetical protein